LAIVERQVVIGNEYGLHFRPAMQLVDVAKRFDSAIHLVRGDQVVNGKSIMDVMMLAAEKGTALFIRADGADAEEAVGALEALIVEKFQER